MVARTFLQRCVARILGPREFGDRLMLAALNVLAVVVSWEYSGQTLPFPKLFAVLHAVAAIGIVASMRWRSITPYAFAATSGVFVGRALAIWTFLGSGVDTAIPTATLVLGGLQWAALAWLVRPSVIVEFEPPLPPEVIEEVLSDE